MIAARDLTGRPPAVALVAAGAIATTIFIVHAGPARVAEALALTVPALPVAFTLEGARIAFEAYGTRALYPDAPFARLLRAQLVSYGAMLILPAGRTAAAAIKGAALAPNRAVAWSAAAVEQSTSLLAVAVASFAVALFAKGTLASVLVAHGALAAVLAAGAWIVARRTRQTAYRGTACVVFATFLGSRAFQLAQVATLACALHVSLAHVAATFGAVLVGASLGDFVPAQLGATDAALSIGATQIGASLQSAAALAIALHVAQLAWLVVAFVMAGAAKDRARSPSGSSRDVNPWHGGARTRI